MAEPRHLGPSTALENLILGQLERHAVASRAEAILTRALDRADIFEVPQDEVGYGVFVCGALFDVCEDALGLAAATLVTEALTPFSTTESEASGVRATSRSRGEQRRALIVVSADVRRANRLAAQLRDNIEVREVRDLFGLLTIAEQYSSRQLVILIDGEPPGARAAGLAAMSRVLPPTTEVVFWGPPPISLVRLQVRVLPRATPMSDVVSVCLEVRDRTPT